MYFETKRNIAIGVSVAILAALGFGERESYITSCESTVTKYVQANFSEVVTGVGADGKIYTEVDTWEEDVSPRFKVVTVDGNLTSTSHDFEPIERLGYYSPPMPWNSKLLKGHVDFDNFSKHTISELRVHNYSEAGGYDSFTQSISKTGKCIDKIQDVITVKTWYTISYSTGDL